MPSEHVQRKLTAILSADAVGYSRMMAEDEMATIGAMTASRTLISAMIRGYRGRVVDSPGDNILADFVSAVDAVACALAIQKALKEKNASLTDSQRMDFRIGINLGDVVLEDEKIFGDGVNIAARIQELGHPGEVVVSHSVFTQVKKQAAFGFHSMGSHRVKNYPEAVTIYRVVSGADRDKPGIPATARKTKRWLWAGAVFVAVVSAAMFGWYRQHRQDVELAAQETAAYPLPEKPSLAVLPFVNMSDDKEQAYFCDG